MTPSPRNTWELSGIAQSPKQTTISLSYDPKGTWLPMSNLHLQDRKPLYQRRRMVMFQEIDRTNDAKLLVERQERLEQILLVPKLDFIDNPFLQIVSRRKNVMNVDKDPRLQYREHLQIFKKNIALRPDHVRGINE